ncbi:Galactosylceramide sulfotransferase [Microtus ochrogaster]|uniref:Galactosylceramide sulfotransferase n=1 Tax=Microtus ochrogaster TaxID=79684 RepID=A0A8J6L0T3_MICOH|nr:Galactosylceramide sulfotransferase [Microtus ochrogaster]
MGEGAVSPIGREARGRARLLASPGREWRERVRQPLRRRGGGMDQAWQSTGPRRVRPAAQVLAELEDVESGLLPVIAQLWLGSPTRTGIGEENDKRTIFLHHCSFSEFRRSTLLFSEMPLLSKKPWESKAKGLVLGALFTSFLLLLYSYVVPPLHPNVAFTTSEPAAPCSPAPSESEVVTPGNGSARRCQPRQDIVFMKTHKTASSTLLNILFRFGQKHGLKFAFPNGRNDFHYPSYFTRSLVQDYRPGACFNIICNHMRFHYEEVRGLVRPGAAFITVIRDPARLFESSFHYFGSLVPLTWKLSSHDKLAEFLQDPDRYYDPSGYNAHYLRNLLFFDLGYDSGLDPGSPRVQEHIMEVERRFHLVLLQEYFDESLVLLRELLCWDLEDVLYFKLNARRDSPVPRLSGELYRRATAWNLLDVHLYRHFNASFWRKVEAFGHERMVREVAELRQANERMRRICIDGGQAVDAEAIQDSAMQPWQPLGVKSILGYNLKKSIGPHHEQLCRRMLTPEIQYLSDLGANLWVTKLWKFLRDFLRW